jgi:hypothetical protein
MTHADIVDLLIGMLKEYRPNYFNQMGKVGYECNFCKRMAPNVSEFYQVQRHLSDCALMQAFVVYSELEKKYT